MDVRRIVTVPIWEEREPAEGELVLRINLGRGAGALAFGFGGHPTTSVSLALLGGLYRDGAPKPRRVLDVGCGTGVLSIACARLAATDVLGIDIAPEAVVMSAENAALNGVADRCRFEGTLLEALSGTFDLVLANLPNSIELRRLAPLLRARSQGGFLVISGYVEDYRDGVVGALEAEGCRVRAELVRAGWCGALLS